MKELAYVGGTSGVGKLTWRCEFCGRTHDHTKVFPVFDFTRRKVHCGCLKGENRA